MVVVAAKTGAATAAANPYANGEDGEAGGSLDTRA
jgi:hypothetical protein